MLQFQVGAIDLAIRARSRPRAGNIPLWKAAWMNRLCLSAVLLISLLSSVLFVSDAFAAKQKERKQKNLTAIPSATGSPGEQSLTNIPLPIGHEAKGLVLPDFDSDGHLRGRFEAARAKRLDEEHVSFQSLKIITYTPESQVDLTIQLSESVLDLKTRILSSSNRTTVWRSDFNLVGDSAVFDADHRTARVIGNVKMVISGKSSLIEKFNQ